MMLALALLAAGCGTSVKVVGTYEEVWQATSDAVRAEAGQISGSPVPPPRGFMTGRAEVAIKTAPAQGKLQFLAEIQPVGSETAREHTVSIFVSDGSPEENADQDALRSNRRRDIEERIGRDIKRRMLAQESESRSPT